MAQIANVGQGQHAVLSPLAASAILLMGLIFALFGIKIWGFKRRLNFERSGTTPTTSQPPTAPPRNARGSQINDNAVQGVFRQRNTEEFESGTSNTSTVNYFTGSVPNLRLAAMTPHESRNEFATIDRSDVQLPQAPRRRRREVHSASFDCYALPPTRQPPSPPAVEPITELGLPNFDHFAEKYELIGAAQPQQPQQAQKDSGGYVKYDPVDDDLLEIELESELLTPVDEAGGGAAAAVSVAAVVHNAQNAQDEEEGEGKASPDTPRSSKTGSGNYFELEPTDSAFVVEIIAGTPDAQPVLSEAIADLFADLETPTVQPTMPLLLGGDDDAEFLRIRATYQMNEADILDLQPNFDNLQLPVATSPPGFGKSIDEDWENFEHLDNVNADVPLPNWAVHPGAIEQIPSVAVTLDEAALRLDSVVEVESLFQELELIEPPRSDSPKPPAYAAELPPLPDYESLMETQRCPPKYTDVMENDKAKYIDSIDDLYDELQLERINDAAPAADSVNDFEQLCQQLEVIEAARLPPQPAPRALKSGTLNVRGKAKPLNCYQPEELPSSSESEAELKPPQPAKRTLKVRFDVENLQYYQSAQPPSSSESDEPNQSCSYSLSDSDSDDALEPPRPMLRLTTTDYSDSNSNSDAIKEVTMLFGAQGSREEELFGREVATDSWRAIQQHRSLTEQLQHGPVTSTESGGTLSPRPRKSVPIPLQLNRAAQTETEA